MKKEIGFDVFCFVSWPENSLFGIKLVFLEELGLFAMTWFLHAWAKEQLSF